MTEKEYGKAKIYLANQDNFPETKKEELLELDEEINVKKKFLEVKQNEHISVQIKC